MFTCETCYNIAAVRHAAACAENTKEVHLPMKTVALALLLTLALSLQTTLALAQSPAEEDTMNAYEQFFARVDTEYAYNLAYTLSTDPALRSSSLGTRTAGSDAEHAAADFLAKEMQSLGLSDVRKVGVPVTKWQFNDATLTLADGTQIKPHSYATAATPEGGVTAEILYVGEGTANDYEGIDATGKIILIDINQRANWWITYPMLEAELRGAAAILSANVAGFSEVSPDALNSQDICGPTAIPCLSISVNDSNRIKGLLEKGQSTATLVVDNVVDPGGTSYNVVGRIPGKTSEEMILVGGHYDMYFNGFQDDNCAVALALTMAKALLESGYTPERDIVFCLHGAEEWGATGTQFDWTVGAWRMINEAQPEWAGKILTFINFELPAYAFADYTYIASAPEMYTLLRRFLQENPNTPAPEGCFPEGVLTEGFPTYTYSDDFSYYIAGVPSTVNGFLLTADQADVYPFYYERYHSQFDDPSTYDAAVMAFNTKLYGALALSIDQTPAYLLDFSAQSDRLDGAFDADAFALAGADASAYTAALADLQAAAAGAYAEGEAINARHAEAIAANDAEGAAAAVAEARAYNRRVLDAFGFAQDALLDLMYERPMVPHAAQMENIGLMQAIVASLEAGDVVTAVDEYAWQVNNVLEWYNFHFSEETTAKANAMFFSPENQGNLFWGTDKMFTPANVEAATRALVAKYDAPDADFSAEIACYTDAIAAQAALLAENVAAEITAVRTLTEMLAPTAAR